MDRFQVGPSSSVTIAHSSCHDVGVNIELFTQAVVLSISSDSSFHLLLGRQSTRGTRTSSAPSSNHRPLPMSLTQRRRWGLGGWGRIFTGVGQARTFYQSCVRERETTAPEDLLNLQAVLEFAGGWQLSGSENASMQLSERMFRLQNQLGLSHKALPLLSLSGVSALFTWGVIAENGSTHIAVVPGGWTEDQLEDPTTYLKVFPSYPFPNIPSSAYGWDQLAPGRGVEVPGGGVHVRWGPDQGGGGQ